MQELLAFKRFSIYPVHDIAIPPLFIHHFIVTFVIL